MARAGGESELCAKTITDLAQCSTEFLCNPLRNKSRRVRNLQKLAFEWCQRAASIDQFNAESARPLVQRCLIIRLDCIFESALIARDLDLLSSPAEEAEHWYWIYCVATSRLGLAGYSDEDWRMLWCRLWALVSLATLMVIRAHRSCNAHS